MLFFVRGGGGGGGGWNASSVLNAPYISNFFIQFCWTSSYVQNIFSLFQNEVKIWSLFFVCVSSLY